MSSSFSTWLETQLLTHTFGGTPYPRPAGLWVALFNTMPTASGGGTELAASGYARLSIAFGPVSGTPPMMSNSAPLLWSAAPVDWGTIVAAGIFDAGFAGNFLGSAGLIDPTNPSVPAPRPVLKGDSFRIPAGYLIVGFALAAPTSASLSMVRPIGAEVVH